jgi:hypothetical protein
MSTLTDKIERWGYRLGFRIGKLIVWLPDRLMRLDINDIELGDNVTPQEDIMQYAIQCFGGPKDGHTETIERDGRPPLVYLWPSADDQRMGRVEGQAFEALRDRLGVFAYAYDHAHFKEGKPHDVEYAYRYDPARNKSHAKKVAKAPKE